VDLKGMVDADLEIRGRHDACIVPRAVPIVEAAVAVVLTDHLLRLGL
jgi:chorismate synthase